jgi:hypothetical protein
MKYTITVDKVSHEWSSESTARYEVGLTYKFDGLTYTVEAVMEDGEYGDRTLNVFRENGEMVDEYDDHRDPFIAIFGEDYPQDEIWRIIGRIEDEASKARSAAIRAEIGAEIEKSLHGHSDFALDNLELEPIE